jgi:hypothetical protein
LGSESIAGAKAQSPPKDMMSPERPCADTCIKYFQIPYFLSSSENQLQLFCGKKILKLVWDQ